MALIENRVTSTILTAIRTRRNVASTQTLHVPTDSTSPAKLREARFSDFKGAAALKERWGMAPDSVENWERLWRYNPALAYMGTERPIGWVLEADNRIVGYIGNIPRLYRYGKKTLTSVTGHGLVVEPAYRGIGVSLNAAYFRQKSVDLYISTGAIAPVEKIGRAFKSEGLSDSYQNVAFWVLRPYPFARAVMKKLSLSPTVSYAGSILGSFAVMTDKTLHRRWPRLSTAVEVTEISVREIGDEFDDLWAQKVNEGLLLLAERTRATLRWQFEVPGDRGTVRVFCCFKNRKLMGYLVVRDEQPEVSGLRKSVIADLLVQGEDPVVVEALFVAAYRHAEQAGSHILEVLGFPPSIQRVWAQWNPYTRKYPTTPFLYKAADPALHETISNGMTWYASMFDGDFSLIRPSYSAATSPSIATGPQGL